MMRPRRTEAALIQIAHHQDAGARVGPKGRSPTVRMPAPAPDVLRAIFVRSERAKAAPAGTGANRARHPVWGAGDAAGPVMVQVSAGYGHAGGNIFAIHHLFAR